MVHDSSGGTGHKESERVKVWACGRRYFRYCKSKCVQLQLHVKVESVEFDPHASEVLSCLLVPVYGLSFLCREGG